MVNTSQTNAKLPFHWVILKNNIPYGKPLFIFLLLVKKIKSPTLEEFYVTWPQHDNAYSYTYLAIAAEKQLC